MIAYRNIAISGTIATGTTTLLNGLKLHLAPLGWRFYSGGEFVREYVAKRGLRLEDAGARGNGFTRDLDAAITKRLRDEERLVIESWLAGYDARDIAHVLKVLLVCSDESLVVDRVVNRDHLTVEEAKRHIKERTNSNLAKWERIYGTRDFWNPKNFDIVIDTYSHGPTETVQLVLEKLGFDTSEQ